jgi:cation diffusion facilitator CzcD-associated flavoprotein CzcO
MTTHECSLDILIIGAGQAGLAAGYYLRQTPYRFQLIESHSRIGESWRQRYDSLILFTVRSPFVRSALPVAPTMLSSLLSACLNLDQHLAQPTR